MPARLFCKVGTLLGTDVEIDVEATIGRRPDNTIVLDRDAISGRHARIARDSERGCYTIEDLGSTNGTRLDGVRVRGKEHLGHLHVISFSGLHEFIFIDPTLCERRHAAAGDSFYDGPTVLHPAAEAAPSTRERTGIEDRVVQLPAGLPGEAPRTPPSPAGESMPTEPLEEIAGQPSPVEGTRIDDEPLPLPGPLGSEAKGPFILEITEPADLRQRFELRPGANLVGRAKGAEVRIKSPDLSRRHAMISVVEGEVTVEDLESQNHTYVEGRKVTEARPLRSGATVRFGRVDARLIRGS